LDITTSISVEVYGEAKSRQIDIQHVRYKTTRMPARSLSSLPGSRSPSGRLVEGDEARGRRTWSYSTVLLLLCSALLMFKNRPLDVRTPLGSQNKEHRRCFELRPSRNILPIPNHVYIRPISARVPLPIPIQVRSRKENAVQTLRPRPTASSKHKGYNPSIHPKKRNPGYEWI
jgi:hypothetical protein